MTAFAENPLDLLPDDGPSVYLAIFKAATIRGIFERTFVDRMSVQTSAPTFLAPKSYLAGVKQGDTIQVGASNGPSPGSYTTFTVAEVEDEPPDFNGWTQLLLKV